MTAQTAPPVVLSASQCWALLREASVGRLAVVIGDLPAIFPVNYVVDHGSVVFRTGKGTKLTAALGRPVAFEVDSFDPEGGQAWSVLVTGTALEVNSLYDVLDALELPLFPWHAAAHPTIVRVEPETVSGRRFYAVPHGSRSSPLNLRSAHE